MYSVVLATVLTAGGASPAWGHHGCHGCCGGYNAFSCSGCCGGCYGCCGGYSSCHGCCGGITVSFGCCGGCHGGCYGSCAGCYGGCYGSCYGCYGGSSNYVPAPPPSPEKKDPKETNARPTQGTVVVELPADATMIVDNWVPDLTSDRRTFLTPDLTPGKDYYYTVKVEMTRDGKKVMNSRKIFVRAGQTTRVEFGEMAEAAARR
jgi:uncharacterized protein (TIGR03000 family)